MKQIAKNIIGFDMSKFNMVFEAIREDGDLIMNAGVNKFQYRPIYFD
jgi:ABC-type branched-subunit amino acid transport system permease subunit